MEIMAKRAESGEAYDQMISEGNAEGNAIVQAAIAALELGTIELEGSDSLDKPDAVFQ